MRQAWGKRIFKVGGDDRDIKIATRFDVLLSIENDRRPIFWVFSARVGDDRPNDSAALNIVGHVIRPFPVPSGIA